MPPVRARASRYRRAVADTPGSPPDGCGYSLCMHPIRWIVGTSLLGLGTALLVTRRELEEERQSHRETVLALETIKQVATPHADS